jgi:hypothetical protein
MVNGWFPSATNYGFEMVDAAHLAYPALVSRHQLKIYGESIQANFPRIYFNADTSDLSTDANRQGNSGIDRARSKRQDRRPGSRHVLPAAFGILARACARAAAERQNP